MEIAALGLKVDGSPVDDASRSLDRFTTSAGRAEKSADSLGSGVDKAGERAEKRLKRVEQGSVAVSRSIGLITSALAAAAGGVGFSRIITETAQFEDAMLGLQAVSGSTADQMQRLTEQARTLGATSMFSAEQAGNAQRFLAQAGFEVNEILSATPGILDLAAAGQIDLARAADIASNVLGGMRLEVDQLNRVNDVLAATAAGSNTSIEQLGQALSFAAPFAAAAGISIEEASAAIGAMSDAGIQASRAGTGLVGIIRQLSNITPNAAAALADAGIAIEDVNIEALGLQPVLDTLSDAGLDTAQAIQIFGSEAGAAALNVIQASGRIEGFTQSLGDSEGAAERMAQVIGSGLTGSIRSFQSAASESVLQLGESGLAGGFKSVIDAATGVISVYNGMLPEFAEANDLTSEQAEDLDTLATGLASTSTVLLGAASGYAAYRTAVIAAAIAQNAFNAAVRANPIGLALTALGAAAGSLYAFSQSMDPAIERANKLSESVEGLTENLDLLTLSELENRKAGFSQDMIEATAEADALGASLASLQEKILNSGQPTPQGGARPIATAEDIAKAKELSDRVDELRLVAESSGRAIEEVDFLISKMGESADNAAGSGGGSDGGTSGLTKSVAELGTTYEDLISKLDPARAALNDYFDTIMDIEALDISDREKDRLRQLAYEQHWERMAEIAEKGGEEAGEKAAEAFENPWQSTADNVARSLQDAIASGDWDNLGDSIGGALGSSISAVVSTALTDALSESINADSGVLSRIGAAFAGPVAGAIAGGIVQRLTAELFDQDLYDPTADRQSEQGTGTVLGSIDAKSESIRRGIDLISDTNKQLVSINTGMLGALQATLASVSSAVTLAIRERGSQGVSVADRGSFGFDPDERARVATLGIATGPLGLAIDAALSSLPVVGGLFDDLIEGAIGLVDDITGGALSGLGDSLFGSKKVVDEGVKILGGTLEDLVENTVAEGFVTIRKSGSLFGGSGYTKDFGTGEIVTDQFTLIFQSLQDSVIAGAGALGLVPAEVQSALDDFVVETQRISLEGLNAEQQAAEIEAVISEIFDGLVGAAVPFIDSLQNSGETLGETLARVATQLGVMNEAIIATGAAIEAANPEQMATIADQLSDLFGGVQSFTNALAGFESNFLTDDQQLANLERRLTGGLGEIDLPATRQAYADLVAAQNLSVEADRERYSTLLQLQDAAAQYYTALEDGAKEAAAAQEQALADLRSSLLSAASGSFSDLQDAVNADRQAATDAYNEERDAIQAATDARLNANRIAIEAARDGLSAIQSEVSGLENAIDSLQGSFEPGQAGRRLSAIETLREALASGDLTGTGEAAGIASQIDASGFSTRADFEREQGRTLNLLGRLEDEGQDQLTTAEETLASLEAQTSVIRASRDAQVGALEEGYRDQLETFDEILSNAQNQLDALNGIDNNILSVVTAIDELSAAVVDALGIIERPATEADDSANEALIAAVYRDILGRAPDPEGLQYWLNELATGAVTYADLRDAILYSARVGGELPQFANGGIAEGPASGYMAELHGREAVIPLSGGSIPLRLTGGDPALLAEIAILRRENGDLMRQLLTKTAAIEDYTRTIRNITREEAAA